MDVDHVSCQDFEISRMLRAGKDDTQTTNELRKAKNLENNERLERTRGTRLTSRAVPMQFQNL